MSSTLLPPPREQLCNRSCSNKTHTQAQTRSPGRGLTKGRETAGRAPGRRAGETLPVTVPVTRNSHGGCGTACGFRVTGNLNFSGKPEPEVHLPLSVCVECLIGKQNKPILFKVTEPSSIPYRTHSACAKMAVTVNFDSAAGAAEGPPPAGPWQTEGLLPKGGLQKLTTLSPFATHPLAVTLGGRQKGHCLGGFAKA